MQLTGQIWDYVIVFVSGVVVSFTPCVYPLIPVTASLIGALNTTGTRLRGFLIAVVYVLGMALTYSALATFAALSGQVFGQLQNNAWIYLLVGSTLLFFALVLLDVVPMPFLNLRFKGTLRPRNLGMVVVLGMLSGLAIGPCTAPVLGTVLLYIASRQNILHGVSLVFVFSYGVGASLILVGTFSGALAVLPKSGKWMTRVKQGCAVVLILVALTFLVRAGVMFFPS